MDEVRWLDDTQERSWRALQQMQMQLTARLARDLAAHSGLSYPDYLVLVGLTDRPDGRARLFELAHDLGWEKSRLSHHVARMGRRRLVTRHKCESDRRGAYLVVTARGRREIAAAAPSHLEAVRRLFIDNLTPGQLEIIGAAAETVLEVLAANRPRTGRGSVTGA